MAMAEPPVMAATSERHSGGTEEEGSGRRNARYIRSQT
jgi:hypothetical protein